jgi:hypothetical protein
MKIKLTLVAVIAMGFLSSQASSAKFGLSPLASEANVKSYQSCLDAMYDLSQAVQGIVDNPRGSKGHAQAVIELKSAQQSVALHCEAGSIGLG